MGFFYIIGRYPQIKKTAKKCGKNACIFSALMIFYQSCGMIAVKREVVAVEKSNVGFPWSECQVRKLTTSHCTNVTAIA